METRLSLQSSVYLLETRLFLPSHNLPGGDQTLPTDLTVYLVQSRLFLPTSQSTRWRTDSPFSLQSQHEKSFFNLGWRPDTSYSPHSLPEGDQALPKVLTVCIVETSHSLTSSQSTWCRPDFPYSPQSTWSRPDSLYSIHSAHSLPGGDQTLPTDLTVFLVETRLSLQSS